MKDDGLYVEQMLDAVRKIRLFTEGVAFETFAADQEKQSAVILQLLIVGELAKRLSEEFKAKSSIPWKQVTGLRDRAVHDYFSLDIEELWKTLQTDIGPLEEALAQKT